MNEWFLGLEARERRILVIGGIIAVLSLLYGVVIDPLYSAVEARRDAVRENTALLRWMRQTAASAPTPSAQSGQSTQRSGGYVVEFNRQVSRAGLGGYIRETRPNGTNGVRARFENVPFDQLVQLIGTLDATTGLRVVNASVERGELTGTISARLTLASG
jgi:general secretion pathway protein M